MFWTIVLAIAFVIFIVPLLFQIAMAIINFFLELEQPGWIVVIVIFVVLLILIF